MKQNIRIHGDIIGKTLILTGNITLIRYKKRFKIEETYNLDDVKPITFDNAQDMVDQLQKYFTPIKVKTEYVKRDLSWIQMFLPIISFIIGFLLGVL